MADLRFIGQVAGAAGATVRATVIYEDDWRDERGFLPAPAYLFQSVDGGSWQDLLNHEASLLGSSDPSWPAPRVSITYTVQYPGLPPLARSVTRHVFSNTDTVGMFDWTLPDQLAPDWSGGSGVAPSVTVQPGQGPAGVNGTSFLSGAGQPASPIGQSGDKYLDEVTYDIWKKVGADWEVIGNIKGATGAKGAEGPKGVDGKSFPVPTQQQINFIPIADGSQPYGFSWRSISQLGLKTKLSQMTDVDMSGIQNGQALFWDGGTSKFVPGDVSQGGTGSQVITLPIETYHSDSPVFVPYLAQGLNALKASGADIIETLDSHKPYYMDSSFRLGKGFRIILPAHQYGNYLHIVAEFNFTVYDSNKSFLSDANHDGSLAGSDVYVYYSDGLLAEGEYYIVPNSTKPGGSITVSYNDYRERSTSNTRLIDLDAGTAGVGWSLAEGNPLKIWSKCETGGAVQFFARATAETHISICRFTACDYNSPQVIEDITIPPDNIMRVYRSSVRFDSDDCYGIMYVSGTGELWGFVDLIGGHGLADPFTSDLHPIRVMTEAEVLPGGLAVVDDGINPPKLMYRGKDKRLWAGVMTLQG